MSKIWGNIQPDETLLHFGILIVLVWRLIGIKNYKIQLSNIVSNVENSL
jgi:hypothetical protein